MTSRFAVLAIDALDPVRVADFWCEVLGWQVREVDDGVITVGPTDGAWRPSDVCRVPKARR